MITQLFIGIDVSKDTLDVSVTSGDSRFDSRSVTNDAKGFAELFEWLTKFGTLESWRMTLEATSAYHRAFVLWFAEKGVAVLVLNPKQARDLARGLGILRKNDATDAKVLAQCALMAWREPVPLPDVQQAELQELSRRMDVLTRQRASERKRLLRPGACEAFMESCRRLIEFLTQEIEQLEAAWNDVLAVCQDLKATHKVILSIPGVGQVTARVVISEMYVTPRERSVKQCVAYAGLAPQEQTSGTSVRRQTRTFKTGNKRLRTALYMGAVSSIRRDSGCRDLYTRIVGTGKAKKIALVAVMNKILRRIAAVAKRGTVWTPEP